MKKHIRYLTAAIPLIILLAAGNPVFAQNKDTNAASSVQAEPADKQEPATQEVGAASVAQDGGQNAEEKTAKNSTQPAGQAADEMSVQSAEKPALQAEAEPAAQNAEKTAAQPTVQNVENAAAQPAVQDSEKAAEQPAAQNAEKSAVQPAPQNAEKAAPQPAAQDAEKAAEQHNVKSSEQPAESPAAQSSEQKADTAVPAKPAVSEETPSQQWNGPKLNRRNGTIIGPSGKETYYNLNMRGIVNSIRKRTWVWKDIAEEFRPNVTGEYHIREDGAKMLGDYIMVAANLKVHPRGSLVETSLGTGVVVDTGGFAKHNIHQIDIAVNW